MTNIHRTTLLTLPNGGRIDLVVTLPMPKGIDGDLLDKVKKALKCLESDLDDAEDSAGDAYNNAESLEIDDSNISEAVSRAVDDALSDAGINYARETADSAEEASNAIERAKSSLQDVTKLLEEATQADPDGTEDADSTDATTDGDSESEGA